MPEIGSLGLRGLLRSLGTPFLCHGSIRYRQNALLEVRKRLLDFRGPCLGLRVARVAQAPVFVRLSRFSLVDQMLT